MSFYQKLLELEGRKHRVVRECERDMARLDEEYSVIVASNREKRLRRSLDRDLAEEGYLPNARVLLKQAINFGAPCAEIQKMIRADNELVFQDGSYQFYEDDGDQDPVYHDYHLEQIVKSLADVCYLPIVRDIFHTAVGCKDNNMMWNFLQYVYTPYLVCMMGDYDEDFVERFNESRNIMALLSASMVPRLCQTGLGQVPKDILRKLYDFFEE